MEKQALRETAIQLRNAIEHKDILSKRISSHATQYLLNEGYNAVSCYYPTKGEVDTVLIISYCLDRSVPIYVPHIFPDNSMSMLRLQTFDDLEVSTYGLMQIKNEIVYSEDRSLGSEKIDIIFTPLLAFDSRKYRLGYGKGFYDNYFSSVDENVKRVGLAFSNQEVSVLPNEPHDINLHVVITEDGIRV